ncbi:MAG: UDP-N-acetylmuramate dehydrogenase [Prevotellaceae bacterium]|jgi:UDP-N-acetylmuramate dehydrogenase|nr:UDP-N-acetylmuramate dehydrogenase [Prevotellaceae bacterium]
MLYKNFSLKDKNTFGFEVFAKKFFEYESESELIDFLRENQKQPERILHIGEGSNLLFLHNFDGIVLHSKINFLETKEIDNQEVIVRVGAGIAWDRFCEMMVEKGFGGTENLSLIYGEVGAAAVQNIGAYGVEIADIIESVETIEVKTAKNRYFTVKECEYGYRESVFKKSKKGEFIVTAINFRLQKNPTLKLEYGALKTLLADNSNPTIADVRRAVISIRESKLPNPKILGNAGSFFKNPYCCKEHFEALQRQFPKMPYYPVTIGEKNFSPIQKLSAAWLIEQCGLKGHKIGGAQVYHSQPLVLVNLGNATPQNIAELSAEVQRQVKAKFSIELETEVNFIE